MDSMAEDFPPFSTIFTPVAVERGYIAKEEYDQYIFAK